VTGPIEERGEGGRRRISAEEKGSLWAEPTWNKEASTTSVGCAQACTGGAQKTEERMPAGNLSRQTQKGVGILEGYRGRSIRR